MMVSEMSEEERQRHLNHRKHHHQDRDRYEKIMSSINKEKLNVKMKENLKCCFTNYGQCYFTQLMKLTE